MLVFDGAGADRDIAEQIGEVAVVFRIEHLIRAGKAGFGQSAHMKFADRADPVKDIGFFVGIRLVQQPHIALTGGAGLAGIDPGDNDDLILYLFLYLCKAADVIEDGVLPVRGAGTDDKDKLIGAGLKNSFDLFIPGGFDSGELRRKGIHLLGFKRDGKFSFKIHIHGGKLSFWLFFIEERPAFGGNPHHSAHGFAVAVLQAGAQLGKFRKELIHGIEEHILIEQEQLAPHIIIDPGDPGQIPEGIAGVVLQLFPVVAGHQRDRDTVGELGNKADHFIVLFRRKDRNMGKPHQPPQLQTVLNGGFGIACGGSHDVIGSAEDPLVAARRRPPARPWGGRR